MISFSDNLDGHLMWRIGERVESGTIEVSRGGLDEY